MADRLSLRVSRWISVTLQRDRRGWRFADWSHLRGKRMQPPAPPDRTRHFRSWEAAAEVFRARYQRALVSR